MDHVCVPKEPTRWMAASVPVNALTPPLLLRDKFHRAVFVPLFLHLPKVATAFQAFMQHPRCLYPKRVLDWFPNGHILPSPPTFLFLFPIPTAQDHDQRPPGRIVRIPAAAFAGPAGSRLTSVCVCVCVAGRWEVGKDLFITVSSKESFW